MVSAELAAFLESAVTILVGTRDASLGPECVRAMGARVERGRRDVTLFVPSAIGARTFANAAENQRVAACFTRVKDHRSIQLKGHVVHVREAEAADRACVDRYRSGLADALGELGLPPRTLFRVAHWPCHAIRFRVEAIFVQTPGPGAGDPMPAREAGSAR